MLTTFKELQRRVQSRIQNTATAVASDDDILPKIKDWLNERYDRVYRSYPWPGTVDNYTLTLTASQQEYNFDRNVYFDPWVIFDQTNGRQIKQDDFQNHIRHHAIDLEQTGNVVTGDPKRWFPVGTYTVKDAIAGTPEQISVVSSSASDIAPDVVRVIGLVGGVKVGETIIITGTTSADSLNTWDASQKLTISCGTNDGTRAERVGKITVTGKTSTTVFSEIAPTEFAHEYHWFRVSPKPKSDGTQPTWEIWHSVPLLFLTDDNDIPVFDCANELVPDAIFVSKSVAAES